MKRFTQLGIGFVIATMFCSSLSVMPATASTETVSCAKSYEVSTKVPVVFVHGLNASQGVWGDDDTPGSMYEYLKSLDNVHRTKFDYSGVHNDWITHPNIGQKLAETIDCLATASKDGGGKGKVIAVGHSQGGLAIEYAASLTVKGHKVGDVLDHVITIATPFRGSILGNAGSMLVNSMCQSVFPLGRMLQQYVSRENCIANLSVHGLGIGSEELKKLPPFPSNVSVKTIAGNVTPEIKLGHSTITGPPQNSDLVVTVDSATPSDRYTNFGKGDGKKVIDCKGAIMEPMISDAPCEHGKLLKNEYVHQEVKKSIADYIASTKVPTANAYGLEIPLTPGWKLTEDKSFTNDSRTTLTKDCQTSNYPPSCNDVVVVVNTKGSANMDPYGDTNAKANNLDCYSDKIHEDATFGSPRSNGTLGIDGVSAKHQVLAGCSMFSGEPSGTPNGDEMHVWRVPERNVMMYTSYTSDVTEAAKLLSQSKWK